MKQYEPYIQAYLEDRKRFAYGFARFVIEQGYGAMVPAKDGKPPKTWQQRGRELYGREFFTQVLREEIEKSKREETPHAEERLPDVRGDQGEPAEGRETLEAGQVERGGDHAFSGWASTALKSAA